MATSTSSWSYRGALALIMVGGILLGAANLIMGDLNQDEGWYLYAARLVSEGWMPYRDFAFTQGPVMPLVYALFDDFVDAQGVGGGRLVTWLLGFASALVAYRLADAMGGRAAGTMALALLLLNVYHSYFTTIVKTYSLCSLLIVLGFWSFHRGWRGATGAWFALAAFIFAAAAATRLSTGALLAVAGLWLLWHPHTRASKSWLWFGAGGAAGLLMWFLPFYAMAPEGFRFGVIEFHTLRHAGSAMEMIAFKAGFVSRLVQAYFVAAVLVLLMLAAKCWRPFNGDDTGYHHSPDFHFVRLLAVSAIVLTVVHVAAPFPYEDYQVPVFALVAIALGVSWSFAVRAWSGTGYRWQAGGEPRDPPAMPWVVAGLVLAGLAASFSSPVNQDWMIAGRDRIWWKTREKPALLHLREVARDIKAEAYDGNLLTQDLYIAVEAGLAVPMSWEMGPFSYYPDMDPARAATLCLVNKEKMLHTLATSPARMAAFSGYGLSIASPDVIPLDDAHARDLHEIVNQRYQLVREVPHFGQAGTTLRIYRLTSSP